MTNARWPSLADQYTLAPQLYGDSGRRLVDEWLAVQTSRVDDPVFAAEFGAVRLPGVAESDFAHRLVGSRHGTLLGGIRFYGRDINRPFVEVIGHDFDDLDALRDCVREEWAIFLPRSVRLYARPGRLAGPGIVTDHTVHAARCRDMSADDGRVELAWFDDDGAAVRLVEQVFSELARSDPALRRNVSPAAPDDLSRWHADRRLHALCVDGRPVGVLAIAAGELIWLHGHEIQEEVVHPAHRGQGYAASAQAKWAHTFGDPDRLLIGMIDGLNTASRRTALRAGRPAVLESVFLTLA
jgi:RimJ/RimL family protein N-acetyltransferase